MKKLDGGKELKKRKSGTIRTATPQPKLQLMKTTTKMPTKSLDRTIVVKERPKMELKQKITVKPKDDNAINRLARNGTKEYIVKSRTEPVGSPSMSGKNRDEQLRKQKTKMAIKVNSQPKIGGAVNKLKKGSY